jgi:hypothetical protein
VNARNKMGATPRCIAAHKGHWKAVKALTALGAVE